MKRPDKWERELAEKLLPVIGDTDTDEQFIEKALPILTASVGTLLQAERAAALTNAANSIRSTIFYREIDVLETRPGYLRDQIADCMEKLATPEAASALAAVVQRETEKLQTELRSTEEASAQHCRDAVKLMEETEKLKNLLGNAVVYITSNGCIQTVGLVESIEAALK